MKAGLILLLTTFSFLTGCDALLDALTKEPEVVMQSQYIQSVPTGDYEWIYCDSLPADAVTAIGYNGRWHAQVPVYKLMLVTTVENIGDDGAGDVTGRVHIYNNGIEVESFTINYTGLLPPGYQVTSSEELFCSQYDSFNIKLSYWDADTEEYDDCDCDCCDCY